LSKAFTREDVDPPERLGRVRTASGLPPGAMNYMTRRGATRLQAELATWRSAGGDTEKIAELERILTSATVVDPPEESSQDVAFGAAVTVEDAAGDSATYHVVGVDELNLESNAVSWVSPIGKALLAAALGQRVTLPGDKPRVVRIVKIEYPAA
jgi:transcription elongation factor GreB